jgi:hypothetical protein
MSFNTRVRVTNLSSNWEVIVTVNGRIPASDPRVADISKDAGDAIGMAPAGLTRVRLEQLQPEQAAPPTPTPAPPPPANPPPARPAPAQRSEPAPAPAPSSREPAIENIQVVSEPPPVQYFITPPAAPVQTCVYSPLCLVMLALLIIAVLLLAAILILLLRLRRIPWWPGCAPWYTPVWLRRYKRYLKKRRD